MDPTTVLRIGSVGSLRRLSGGVAAADSSGGGALLGALRVAERTESYERAPFRVPAGALVFGDGSGEIRCAAAGARVSWFLDGVAVLLTHWRFVAPPAGLRGATAGAWAHIEILSPPVLLRAGFAPPAPDRPLSWWRKHQVHPELELERRFLAAAEAGGAAPRQPAVLGAVCAVSGILPGAARGEPAFVAETAQGAVLVRGRRHLGLLAALCPGDALFVSALRPATLGGGRAAFVTTAESQAFRIDEFDGLGESQAACAPSAAPSPFTHCSHESLLTQIGRGSPAQPAADERLVAPPGRLESYAGEVTRIVDPALGVYVVDGAHLLVLARWPQLSPLLVLRPGSRVLLENVHAMLLADSDRYRWSWIRRVWPRGPPLRRALVFGACARSSVRVTEFPALNEPAGFPCVVDHGLAAAAVRRTAGLVQLIEAIEAHWRLLAKFPAGPPAERNSGGGGGGGGREAAAQAMDMALALALAGAAPDAPRGGSGDACAAFVDHAGACDAVRPLPGGPCRVVKLRDVIRRFAQWRQQQPVAAGRRPGEPWVAHVCPADLGLEGAPLIGRLAASDRGCVYLRDATGQIRARPTAAVRGQALAGHVCAWRSWRLVVEAVDATPEAPEGSALPAAPVHFSLVYAHVAGPLVLRADPTFGGLAAPRAPAAAPPSSWWLVVVHSQGPAMARAAGAAWSALSIVRGAGVALGAHSPLLELLHSGACGDGPAGDGPAGDGPAGDGPVGDGPVDAGASGPEAVRAVHVRCPLDAAPASFAPGAAYVLCIHGPSGAQELSADPDPDPGAPAVVLELGPHDHVHPVRAGPAADRRAGAWDQVAAHMPRVRLGRAEPLLLRQPAPLPVAGLGGAEGTTVSVCGTVQQREVTRIVAFGSAEGDGAPVAAQLDTRVTLQDDRDGTQTATAYLKLSSLAHPLGLVPGARVVLRDVSVGVSRTTGKLYLSGSAATSVDEPAPEHQEPEHQEPEQQGSEQQEPEQGPDQAPEPPHGPDGLCIARLYAEPGLRRRPLALRCYVDSVEGLRVALRCVACQQPVCGMACVCAQRRHRVAAGPDATARPELELVCLASDGSGVAWLVVTREPDVACVLGLQRADLAGLYAAAAQAWNGQLVWRPPARDPDRAPAAEGTGAVARAAAAAAAAAPAPLLVEGAVAAAALPARRQPLRMDGRSVSVNKHAAPRIVAARVARPATTVAELCWQLLQGLPPGPG
ncbi:hypothetical protein H4R18_002116 [Coemansia javaensis]|uniref:CST complex subunit CTC1 n=1 Tax=Coemansia javaensis TaxID=2761396 RepID=A0A9W8HFD6_9FUNG|nr:hypothetical protein H4R18_002116 [Coemansia javaensis]